MLLRRERPDDVPAVQELCLAAFGRPTEPRLLAALRQDEGWLEHLALVAEHDGRLVGHVCCTRARVGDVPALGLGPIGVHPAHQRRGTGSALVHAVVAAAEARDERLVCLLGDPAFYGRLGFVDARALGVAPPDVAWGAFFQARRLAASDPSRDLGAFRYAAPFDAASG